MPPDPVQRSALSERRSTVAPDPTAPETLITEGATDWRRWRVSADADSVTVRTWTTPGKFALLVFLGVLLLGACVLAFPRMSTEQGAVGGVVVVCIAIAVMIAGPFLVFFGLAREEVTITRSTARVMRRELMRSRVRVSDIGHGAHVRTLRRVTELPGFRLEIESAAQTVHLGSWMPASAARHTAESIGRLLLSHESGHRAASPRHEKRRAPPPAQGSPSTGGVVRRVEPDRTESNGRRDREPVLVPDMTAPSDGLRWVEGAEGGTGIDWMNGHLLTRGAIGAVIVIFAAGAGAVYLATAAVLALIVLFAPGGLLDARRRSRLRSVARRHPGEPWLWTDVWALPITVARGGVQRLHGDNVDRVMLPAPACRPSGRLTLDFVAGEDPLDGDVTFTLRRLAAQRPNDDGVRPVALTHIGRTVVPSRGPGESMPVSFTFAGPAAGTRLGSRDAAIWMLVAEGRTRDYRTFTTEFPLPLFEEA